MKYFIYIFIFTFLSFSNSIQIENIYIDKNNTSLSTIKTILEQNSTYKLTGSKVFLGIIKYPVYIKIKVPPINYKNSNIIYITSPRIENIELYNYNFNLIGTSNSNNNITLYPFFYLDKNISIQNNIYYIKTSSIYSAINFIIGSSDLNNFLKQDFYLKSIILLLYGVIVSLVIYAIFVYFNLKDKTYLSYSIYLIAFLIQQIWYLGLNRLYFNIKTANIFTFNAPAEISLLIITWTFFMINFFYIKKDTLINKIFIFFIIIATLQILVTLLTAPSYYQMIASISIASIFISFCIVVGIYMYNSIQKHTKYFIIAYILTSILYILAILEIFGYIYITSNYPYLLEITIALEGFILLLALLERYKYYIKQHIQILEINHRIKNNLSLIKALIHRYKANFKKLLLAIDSIAQAHSQLFIKDTIEVIEFKEYLEQLIFNLKNTTYNNWNINLNIQNSTIELQKAINVGIILNELITNSFKYVNNKNNILNISLKIKDKYYELIIEDNGNGYNIQNVNINGIAYVNGIVKYMLNGKITAITNNKTKYIIRWRI